MDIFSFFTLFGGLAFFMFGMSQMSNSLEKVAGGKMEYILNKMTSNRFKGLALGAVITVAIQSSSAVTVMLVGLVNSGIMDISNTVGVIMGSNVGTTVTAWIMSLIGVSSDNVFVRLLKPESFAPLLAFIGIVMIMVCKTSKRRDIGTIFIGFAILMYGMTMMSGSVSPLAKSPKFMDILTAFNNPVLGILTGLVVTAVIQSSAASVGMLQALSLTGGITYGMAFPIIMGQNIGTCATAVISSIGVSRSAKRVAVIHISFNIIGTVIFMAIFYGLHFIFDFAFASKVINPVGIALCHSIFNIATTLLLLPFTQIIVKIAMNLVKTKEEEPIAFLDERLLKTPTVAIAEATKHINDMADMARESMKLAMEILTAYDEEKAEKVKSIEQDVDIYEDHLGSYLVKLSGSELSDRDIKTIGKMLHTIGNFERISDHARNLAGVGQEISEKKVDFSSVGRAELRTITKALDEILDMTIESFHRDDLELAVTVEPLEQVIDGLVERIKRHHIVRLQKGECTIQNGFVLSDILNNYERVSDHCSNIAIAVIEKEKSSFDPHDYLNQIRSIDDTRFQEKYKEYKGKYVLEK